VAIRSCLSEPVTPSGQARLSHEARVAVGGSAPSWRLADRPGGCALHDGPAVRRRPHRRVAVTTRGSDHRRRHSQRAANPGRLRCGNIGDAAVARSGHGGVDHGGGADSHLQMPLRGARVVATGPTSPSAAARSAEPSARVTPPATATPWRFSMSACPWETSVASRGPCLCEHAAPPDRSSRRECRSGEM